MAQADSNISTPAFVDPTRRRFLSQAAGVAAGGTVLALATIPPASAGALDGDLRQAADDLAATDLAIAAIFKTFGDDAEDREDYLKLEEQRDDCIAVLIEVQAASMVGIQAKASALRLKTMIEDYDQHQQIAVSLADDLVGLDHLG
jgi:hypothetical protein